MIWIIAVLAVSLPVLGFANGQYQSPQPHPTQQYGPPPQPPQQYGPPPQPPQQYGPPPQPSQQYGPPPQPSQQYGPPPQPSQQYGPPPQPPQQYGPPPQPPQQYGPPPQPPQQYGPPTQPPQQYGPPPPPHFYGPPQQYGPPTPQTSSHRVIPQHGDVITISGPPSYSPAYPAESHQHYPDDHYHEQSQQNNDQQHYHEQQYGDQGYADYDQFGLYDHFKGVGDDQKSVDLSSPGYGPPSPQYGPQPQFVPVIIHKNDKKKRKTLSVQKGFFAPGGTQMFGKFKDLFSCMKACELTATCFAGDFDPWQQKCFSHSNHSACAAKRIHPSITHFSKVPCELIETGRGLITLGAQTFRGIEVKGVDTLKECLKACTTAGGGIASSPSTITSTPQICFGIDYDFGGHKCYIHTDSTPCIVTTATISTPQTLVANPSTVSIILCPKAATP